MFKIFPIKGKEAPDPANNSHSSAKSISPHILELGASSDPAPIFVNAGQMEFSSTDKNVAIVMNMGKVLEKFYYRPRQGDKAPP